MKRRQIIFGLLLSAALLLGACQIEGGVPEPTALPTAATEMATPAPLPTSATVANAIAQRRDTWVIGMLEQPADLYPYPATPSARRVVAPISELIFPSPVLAYSYAYTGTGVLDRVPSLDNGDIQIVPADVYLDAAGNITTTVTAVITQVNQIEVTFHWNEKLMWSDGTPLTADDSVFAYEMARATPPGDDARLLIGQIDRYEAIDEHTTRAVLKPDVIGWTAYLSYWTPLPRHLLKDVDPDAIRDSAFARTPVGYGPYMIEEVLPGEIRMVRNPHYYGAPPPASRVTFAFLRDIDAVRANIVNGNLDLAATDRVNPDHLAPLDRAAGDGLQVTYVTNPIWEHIDFNLDVPILQDIRVRRAIALGTDRARISEVLYGGRTPVIESWVLPGQAEAAPLDQITRYAHDADAAGALLEEAGYVPGLDGIRASAEMTLTLQLFTSEGPVRERVAELFREDMRAIGIDIEVITLSTAELFSPDGPLFQRQFELALYAWIASPDPGGLQLWSCRSVPSENNAWSGDNFAGWCFRDADRAIREATTTLDPEVRRAAYLKQQQLWTQEIPSLPLFQRMSVVVSDPAISGIAADPLAPVTWNIAAWRREP
jgi:peptide/nickel transport system substrate-binding protein